MNRFTNAIAIQQGACNPSGVARSLVQAIDECRAEGKDTPGTCADPAVRLIAHQLSFLLNVGQIDNGDPLLYGRLMNECEMKAAAIHERAAEGKA